MKNLKITILLKLRKGFWGGGNQFLKMLRKVLIKKDLYEKDPNKADCIIFNSHHQLEDVLKVKFSYQKKIFIHRIDGPLSLHRDEGLKIDKKIYEFNNKIADGTIFQSHSSMKFNKELGLKKNFFETIITNSVDNKIFYVKENKNIKDAEKDKWNLIAVSWSTNPNKGFDLYRFLDHNLDFNRYSMKFIGNSPINFKNIEHIKPVELKILANFLRNSDIYITGARKEACSNSIIEALACGLPCVVLNDTSNPEVLKTGGELFNNYEECLEKIELVRENYEKYLEKIRIPSMEDITELYISFIQKIFSSKNYRVKSLRKIEYLKLLIKYNLFQNSKFRNITNKIYSLRDYILRKFKKQQN
jgi:glycosyltransferase involved in cell wall biosynthesis